MIERSSEMDHRQLMYFARELRQQATWAEKRAWEILRDRRCLGFKFRRQFPFRGFVLDFFCRELSLNIEVDGDIHDEPANKVAVTMVDLAEGQEAVA